MAHNNIKRRLVRRKPVEEEEEIEEPVEEEEVEDEEIEESDEEEEEEEVKPRRGIKPSKKVVPEPKKIKSVKPVKKAKEPEPEPEPEPEDEEVEEEEEEEVPAKKIKVQKVETVVLGSIVAEAMNQLADGKVIVVKSIGHDKFAISYDDAAPAVKEKLRGRAYWDIVENPDYRKWTHEWHQKSYEQKVAFAEKKKIQWDRQKNPKVDVIHLTEAVRRALGVEKYLPEYRSRSARMKIRGG